MSPVVKWHRVAELKLVTSTLRYNTTSHYVTILLHITLQYYFTLRYNTTSHYVTILLPPPYAPVLDAESTYRFALLLIDKFIIVKIRVSISIVDKAAHILNDTVL